jgi:acetyltransferase-like isoleucine patch superfamily enzyme
MTDTNILLSICIPTYNRGSFLKQTLESIVSQDVFLQTHEVEVIISDNCSDDETESVAQEFATDFPGKIKYIKNTTNVGPDVNFELALSRGSGAFMKLHNDNLLVRQGALVEMLKIIRATEAEKPILFFTNGNFRTAGPIGVCLNFNEFVKGASFMSTWIGGFGLWRDEFHGISDFLANANLRIVQTDILFRLLATGKRAIILYESYFVGLSTGRKGGDYNIAEVFGKNYLSLLKKYVALGLLNQETFQAEKKVLLLNHILPYYFDSENDYPKSGFFIHMQDYLHDDYFYQAIEGLIASKPKNTPPLAPAPISQEQQISDYWRLLNPHNETSISAFHGRVDFDRVKVGRKSYGGLTIFFFGREEERLTIGDFVSIANNVKFLLGGNHAYDKLSTFPFLTKYFATLEAGTKGPIVVANDAWIGYDCTILSGVTIGQGAVVAAGSVVTKDVAPYSIVGGNPAKLIKYRFEPVVIEKLLQFDFSRLSDQVILQNRETLYTALSPENIDSVLNKLSSNG